jgi:ATP-dependent DNA helicase RecQ
VVLAQAPGEYPILKLTPGSWAVMRGEKSARLIRLAQKRQRGGQGTATTANDPKALPVGADPELFEMLRQIRRQEAARAGTQPYQVFPDNVLAELARGRPTTEDALRRVSGVGEYRLQAFGRVFLDAVVAHCERTGLATNVPLPRSTAPVVVKSGPLSPKKEQAFRLFRAGAGLDVAAAQTGLTRSTVGEFLADFIRVEKPASIFGWVPEAVCERVAAAAEMHGTARMKPVFLELNGEVSYDDIRLVLAFLDARKPDES